MNDHTLLIKNVRLYTETGVIEKGCLLVKGKTIEAIEKGNKLQEEIPKELTLNGNGLQAIPGFIDGHIHGTHGADVMDATQDSLEKIAKKLPEEGTTSFLATTITQSPENIEKALANIAVYNNRPNSAELLGVHLEGPFIEKSKAGAQPKEFVISPSIDLFNKWQSISGNKIKTITLAPEKDEDHIFIKTISNQGIKISAGHTNAGFNIMKKAVEAGVNQVTHLCNAMTGLHHRDIGLVGAAFLLQELRSELIADGIHVSPEMIKVIYQNIGPDRLILITDAIRAKGLEPGQYDLGGQRVTVNKNRAKLADGTLAGSVLKMIDAIKNIRQMTGAAIEDLIKMASYNPAKQLNLDNRKGSLNIGKDADILLVDDDLNIHYTICQGQIVYKEVR
ncbi:N-acetylglucosamine-6-phosphate deacetylase [Alkalihalobacterium elongatum]|uniref:N-acetylglucosamine-6-phosphate deacetylase n=1 Tax=Alkalihalobacterium elongatum TaxID=2675466 RepID=UPI001C1FE3E0|nr:N-acetylglucosamine-6-phosphate deacetylase [Alkalihalobacterium elongatum]